MHSIGKILFYLGTTLFIVCSIFSFKYGSDAVLFLITIGVMTLGLGISYFSTENIVEKKSSQFSPAEELNELLISLEKRI